MAQLTTITATQLFWRIGDKLHAGSAARNPRVFQRMAFIRRRLVDAFNIDFRKRPSWA